MLPLPILLPLEILALPATLGTENVSVSSGSASGKNSPVTQPIEVVASDGSALAGPLDPDKKTEGTFTVPNRALTCKGSLASPSKTEKLVYIPIRCSNGLKGSVTISRNEFVGDRMTFWIGPVETPTTVCAGNFYLTGNSQGPFQVECNDVKEQRTGYTKTKKKIIKLAPRTGAALVVMTLSGSYQTTVWIPK